MKGTLKKQVTIKERGGYKPFKAKHFGGFKGTVPTQYHIPSCIQRNEFVKRSHKNLESEIQFLRKEIKEKNTLISSMIPLKILESKYCEANNLQNSNSRTIYLQERGTETTASGNALVKNGCTTVVQKITK